MDFERGIDPKKSIGLGSENIAIEITGLVKKVWVSAQGRTFPAHKKMTESNNIRVLLGIGAKKLRIEEYSVINSFGPFINGRRKKYIPLKEFRGKWLNFKSHIYYIPYE